MSIKYRKISKHYKYLLVEDYEYELPFKPNVAILNDFIFISNTGKLLIKKGYAWDGPSGPTIDTKSFMRGSLIHDALYQLIRSSLLPYEDRKIADDILFYTCVEDKMNKFRAYYVYIFVRIFARFAAKPVNSEINIRGSVENYK